MAKKPTTEAADVPSVEIVDDAYYTVEVSARFKMLGVGFGAQSQTQVTGALLRRLLAGEHSGKIAGYVAV